MKVFLLQTVKKIGTKHSVVDVKDGYAKNYLIRQGLAIVCAPNTQKQIKALLTKNQINQEYQEVQLNLLKKTLESCRLEFFLKSGHQKEFGKITHEQIIKKLAEQEIILSKHVFKDHKNYGMGVHEIALNLGQHLIATLIIEVKPEQ